jgi:GNAT superfamily N-acetyltransferase
MKRLYVRPSHRGRGLGRVLAERLIADARAIGYDTMRLDTLDAWHPAVGLYRSLGFNPTERYNDDLDPHTLFMALDLRRGLPG